MKALRNVPTLLTELCLRSTYQFREENFEQVDGAAMGSPLSPIVANLYMESLKRRALEKAPQRPKRWIRYVDAVNYEPL